MTDDIAKEYSSKGVTLVHPSGVRVFTSRSEIISQIENLTTELTSQLQAINESLADLKRIDEDGA